jgi:nicotinate-nucleotide adenylyltransferase
MGSLIGVFGGTFDPPHIGHCILADEALQHLGLDMIYWVPAGEPPHKPDWPISPIEQRLRMLAYITFVYLMGADSLRDLTQWKDPEQFVERAHAIGIMQRPSVEVDHDRNQRLIPGLSEKLLFFPAPLIDISGQSIRQRVKHGQPYRYMLTPEVYDHIRQHKLYQ